MTREVVIRLTIPDGVEVHVEEQHAFAEASEAEPVVRTIATEQPRPLAYREGDIHTAGHKPLRARGRHLFCPTKLPSGEWCSFSAPLG